MTHIWSLTHIHKSDQFLFTPQGQPLQIWCIWSYLIINIIIEIIITDQSSSMVTLQVQPPQRLCIWWSALERSRQALLDTCLLSDPALFRDIICKLVCYTTPYINKVDWPQMFIGQWIMPITITITITTWSTWRWESTETLTSVGMKCSSGAQVSENHSWMRII